MPMRALAAALALLGACIGLAALPWTFPGEDARYALAWGDEILRLHRPDFDGPVPAKHPLTLAIGVLLAPLGANAALLAYGAISFASFFLLGYAAYRLGRVLAGPAAGALAAVIALTRPETILQLATAGKDLPFVALVLLAAALAVERGVERPLPVLGLLAAAGLIRPEAWGLAGAFWVWLLFTDRGSALRPAPVALVLAAPLIWIGTDLVLAGGPLDTLQHGREKATALERAGFESTAGPDTRSTLARIGDALGDGIAGTAGWGVFVAALIVVGGLVSGRSAGGSPNRLRRFAIPLVLVAVTAATAIIIAIAGLALPPRFLFLAALAVVAVAAASAGLAGGSRLALIAFMVAIAGTVATVPGDLDRSRDIFAERQDNRRISERLIELAQRPSVDPAIEQCPQLAVGGRKLGRVSLARTVGALATGQDVSDFEIGRAEILRRFGSGFAFRLGPEDPAFGRDRQPDKRTALAEQLEPWIFASRCTG